ncbi:MAG: CopD family protein [Burkholderiaceae bacterium]
MPATMGHALLLLLHLLGAIVWVGGMFFAHFALRPAAAEVLPPPQRIALMVAALRRFFGFVTVAVIAVLGSGFALLARVGLLQAPVGWHVMMGCGVVMALVFVFIVARLFPRLVALAAAASWPEAGAELQRIRSLVAFNLGLGLASVLAAVWVWR